ncbi:NADPH:quinone reductase [Bounagaea algeriensis]
MRAAYLTELGPADNIRVGELDLPELGPADVLVRVGAVAVNPVDGFVRSGAYPTPVLFPFVVGRDLVGTVAALGSRTTGFDLGERVWCNSLGHDGRQGAASEYARVPADRLYRLPEGVDPVTAVAVVHPTATAQLALVAHARLTAGETVYIAGGAGHVGGAAVVLAARAGARVVASASAADLEHCRSLGAGTALDYRDPELGDHLRAAAPDGIDVHLDTSGKHDLGLAVDLLAARGRIVLMAGISATPELPVGRLYTRGGSAIGFTISNATIPELAGAAARINQLLAEGALAPRDVETLPLDAAAEAHRRLESGRARGTRLVLRP